MTPHQVIAIAVRLFAVWIGVYALRSLPSFYAVARNPTMGLISVSVFILLAGACVLLLWFFPRLIAHKLLPPPVSEPSAPAPPDTWLAMGCALIGLWVATWALPAFVRQLLVVMYEGSHSEVPTVEVQWLLYDFVEVVVAAWLILGATGFRRLFWWARSAGYGKAL